MKCNNDCFNCQYTDCILPDSDIRNGQRGRPRKYLTEAERKAANVRKSQKWAEKHRGEKRVYDREYYHNVRKPKMMGAKT